MRPVGFMVRHPAVVRRRVRQARETRRPTALGLHPSRPVHPARTRAHGLDAGRSPG